MLEKIIFWSSLLVIFCFYKKSSAERGNSTDIQCEQKQWFTCKDGTTTWCIPTDSLCDGDVDCPDYSDEDTRRCLGSDRLCSVLDFKCATKYQCIAKFWVCDGLKDCSDGSDEGPQCNYILGECLDGQFSCLDHSRCIDSNWRCDRFPDCVDSSDEWNCVYNTPCTSLEFKCQSNHECVPRALVCNGEPDCMDGSDEEAHCNITDDGCPAHRFRCKHDSLCIPHNWRCDGVFHCSDFSDEMHCGYDNNHEYDNNYVYDYNDAYDYNDMYVDFPCSSVSFTCNSTGECILKSWVCDGDADCKDGSDERSCNRTDDGCHTQQFRCNNDSTCIPRHWQCDGLFDCSDFSDELNCGDDYSDIYMDDDNLCPESEFTCDSMDDCIPKSWVCDGLVDCKDRSDERSCSLKYHGKKDDAFQAEVNPAPDLPKSHGYTDRRDEKLHGGNSMAIGFYVLLAVLVLALLGGAGGLLYYGRSHPGSTFWKWLAEHKPSYLWARFRGRREDQTQEVGSILAEGGSENRVTSITVEN